MPGSSPAFEHAWALYRDWAMAARSRKAAHSRRQALALLSSTVGAVLGALASLTSGLEGNAPRAFAALTAAAVGLGTYLGQQVLASTREREWYRARGIAESLKSQCMRFAAGAPPYDGADPDAALSRACAEISEKGMGIPALRSSDQQRRAELPTGLPWTADEYARRRVQHQVDWYGAHARLAAARVRACRGATIVAGALSVVLAAAGQELRLAALGAFVPVITALGALAAAYLYAGRYAFLETSYTAVANRLEDLLAAWRGSGKGEGDREARAAFIARCEAALSIENGAWVAEHRGEPGDDAGP